MTSARDCQNEKTKPRPKEPAGAAGSKVRGVRGARLFCTRHLGLRFLAPIFQALARSQVEVGGRRATAAQSVGSDVVPNVDSRTPTYSNAAIPSEALKQPLYRSYSAARRASSHTAQIHDAAKFITQVTHAAVCFSRMLITRIMPSSPIYPGL